MFIRNEVTKATCEIKSKSEIAAFVQHVIPNPVLEYVHQAMLDVMDYVDGRSDDLDREAAKAAAKILLDRCQGLAHYVVVCDASNNPPSTADEQTIITLHLKTCTGSEWVHSFSTKEL